MKRLLLCVCAMTALAVFFTPSPASAWTHCGTPKAESDCPPITVCINGQTQQVPDTGTLPPGATEGQCVPPPKLVEACVDGKTVMIPEDQVGKGQQGACVVPPAPPAPPAPPTPPAPPVNVTVCRNGDTITVPQDQVLPTDTPDSCAIVLPDEQPKSEVKGKVDIGTPDQVAGKEQERQPTEVAPAETATLPFTGGGTPWQIIAGLGGVLLALGAGVHRATRGVRSTL